MQTITHRTLVLKAEFILRAKALEIFQSLFSALKGGVNQYFNSL